MLLLHSFLELNTPRKLIDMAQLEASKEEIEKLSILSSQNQPFFYDFF